MKIWFVCVSLLFSTAAAFVVPANTQTTSLTLQMGYVPDGMSPEQYKKLKQKEQEESKKKRFGAFGPQTFKSRSLQSFQQDLEKGKAAHLMPMFNAKEQLAKGKIKKEDIPYMQRGGSWDNTDVKGAKKKNWNEADKNYDQNQLPMRVDWMGVSRVQGPAKTQNKKQEAPPKKKGWFGFSP
mmetsp:Transcript_5387/g.10408  ORF Transcript_5387/g.10408 Transcript_5387/m.10408 type:complete len:181 (-) Transcript_5387:157-699(-)